MRVRSFVLSGAPNPRYSATFCDTALSKPSGRLLSVAFPLRMEGIFLSMVFDRLFALGR